MKIKFSTPQNSPSEIMVVLADDQAKLIGQALDLDKTLGGKISSAIKSVKFEGKSETILDLVAPGEGVDRLIVVGLGAADSLQEYQWQLLGGSIAGALQAAKVKSAMLLVDCPAGGSVKPEQAAALLASGAQLRSYRFDTYKTSKKDKPTLLAELTVTSPQPAQSRTAFEKLSALIDGVNLARNLVNEPANILTPVEFASRAAELAKLGVEIETLGPTQMKKLGMNAMLGVAQGSALEPRLVIMKWNGGKKGDTPLAFVGKGVTFDSGGLSIKPAAGMEDMKGDMAGAAAVTGLMLTLARRKAPVNVVAAIGLVENGVDGKAQRPGDIVKSMSGQTIAVLNTDAEGRLVLADVLWYTQDRFKPKAMINLATLTGAIVVALGREHAGLFSNNDELANQLLEAGKITREKLWRMPLSPEYDKLIDYEIADVKNTGGRTAGSITAAQFLQRFVNNVPWAHLDIAGTAMDSIKTPINQSWASGWGVRLLNQLVADHYEKTPPSRTAVGKSKRSQKSAQGKK